MKLGELVKQYRSEHNMSLRDFSRISGISNGYVSMLEKNEHPKTKKPIVPSIEKMKHIASAMGMSLDKLLGIIDDDQPVSIGKISIPHKSMEKGVPATKEIVIDEKTRKLVDLLIKNPEYEVLIESMQYIDKGDIELVMQLLKKFHKNQKE